MDILILILEIIGTISFAISGAMTGLRKKMDIFGVMILGLTTATGGGILRDVILGITPPQTFCNPIYALLALAVAALSFIPALHVYLLHNHLLYDKLLQWMDALGLGVFTVVGMSTAFRAIEEPTAFLLIFVAVLTGVGGGILRDILAGDTPYIFVKHIYASASLLGALLCLLLWPHVGQSVAMLSGGAAIVLLRLLSARYRWNLPRAKNPEEEQN